MLTGLAMMAWAIAMEPTMDVDPTRLTFIEQDIPGYPSGLKGSGVSASCLATLVVDGEGFVATITITGCGEPFRTLTEENLFRWRIQPYAPYGEVERPQFMVSSEFVDPRRSKGIPQGPLIDVTAQAMQWTSRPALHAKGLTAETSCTTDVVIDRGGKPVHIRAQDCEPAAVAAVEKGLLKWRGRARVVEGREIYYRVRLPVPVKPK